MNVLICDDDVKYAKQCEQQLLKLSALHQVKIHIDKVASGKLLLFFYETKFAKTDLIYLDHHMPEVSGMETALALRKKNIFADIVFYTVDDSKAIDAFDVDALHYIVKGRTDNEKFEEIFLKANKRIEKRQVEIISLACAGEHRNVPIQDILYFEVQSRIVTVHYINGQRLESFEFYSSLSRIEEFLYEKGFIRIHSSYLVGERHIHKKNGKEIEMADGRILPIGKTYRGKV